MATPRILIALEAACVSEVQEALRDYDLLLAVTLSEAQKAIAEDGIELFVIGVHFDDSRSMELIRLIRLDRKHKKVPIIVTRMLPTIQTKMLHDTLELMKVLMGITDYLELEGDPGAKAKLKSVVKKTLFQIQAKKSR